MEPQLHGGAMIVSALLPLAFIIILIVIVVIWLRHDDDWPPGPSLLQMVTYVMPMLKRYQYKELIKIGAKYGGLFTLRIFGTNYVVINDWTIMKEALHDQSEVFAGRPEMYLAKRMLQNTDILFIDGPELKEKRHFVLHNLRNLGFGKASMEGIVLDEISKLMDVIEAKAKDGRKILINGLFFLPAFNVLYGMIAGKQYGQDDQEVQELSQTLKGLFHDCHSSIEMNFLPWLRFVPKYADLMNGALTKFATVKAFLTREIDRHVTEFKTDADGPRNLVDAYLSRIQKQQQGTNGKQATTTTAAAASSCYTKSHLIGTVFDLLQAGIETTSSTLEWTVLYMALWPQVQTKVQEELDRIVGLNRLPSYADHSRATILEIHRYATVVPMSGPHCTMTSTTLAGYKIPKRTTVFQNIWAVHNDVTLWTDPQTFRPERFLDADGNVHKPEYLIPFSLGARVCIGESLARLELFLFIACLLQRFRFGYACGEPPPTLRAKPLQTRSIETVHLVIETRY